MSKFRIDFCIVGPQRTGSTWVYNVINKYNIAGLPKNVKETYFFDKHYSKGIEYYSNLFEDYQGQARGEVATTYFDNFMAIQRIQSHNPQCKIVIIYRNPIDRAISLYNHHKKKGRVSGGVKEAISSFPSIIEGGKYSKWIPQWTEYFGDKNVKILNYKLLCNNPQEYIDDLFKFLSLERICLKKEDLEVINQSSNPKYKRLAKIAAKSTLFLRENGGNRIVNFGKRIGLNKIYQGAELKQVEEEEIAVIQSYFEPTDFLFK